MKQETKSRSNKPLNFWQRLKVAKAHRIKVRSLQRSFLKELCDNTNDDISKLDKMFGYLHYEAGLSLFQISNDMALDERHTRRYNENLLKALGVKTPSGI